jgi:hypothetical protein
MHECINVKNPPNCVGGIRVLIRVSFLASLLLALLLNTSSQFYTAVYYFPVFYKLFRNQVLFAKNSPNSFGSGSATLQISVP